MITVDNIYHSQNVSSNRDETVTVTCSHSAQTVEFRYGFKLLRLALLFQSLTVIIIIVIIIIISFISHDLITGIAKLLYMGI